MAYGDPYYMMLMQQRAEQQQAEQQAAMQFQPPAPPPPPPVPPLPVAGPYGGYPMPGSIDNLTPGSPYYDPAAAARVAEMQRNSPFAPGGQYYGQNPDAIYEQNRAAGDLSYQPPPLPQERTPPPATTGYIQYGTDAAGNPLWGDPNAPLQMSSNTASKPSTDYGATTGPVYGDPYAGLTGPVMDPYAKLTGPVTDPYAKLTGPVTDPYAKVGNAPPSVLNPIYDPLYNQPSGTTLGQTGTGVLPTGGAGYGGTVNPYVSTGAGGWESGGGTGGSTLPPIDTYGLTTSPVTDRYAKPAVDPYAAWQTSGLDGNGRLIGPNQLPSVDVNGQDILSGQAKQRYVPPDHPPLYYQGGGIDTPPPMGNAWNGQGAGNGLFGGMSAATGQGFGTGNYGQGSALGGGFGGSGAGGGFGTWGGNGGQGAGQRGGGGGK